MTTHTPSAWNMPGPWLGILMGLGTPLAVFAYLAAGWIAGLAVIAALGVAALAIARRFKQGDKARAYGNAALARYTQRLMLASMGYVVGLMIAIAIHESAMPNGPLAYAVALLPTIPALAMIFAIGRYLVEETDEYQRHRASLSAIIGLGFVLVLGTVWGFLETFGLARHIWAWWVVPVWAIGMAIGQGWIALRERGLDGDDEDDDEGDNEGGDDAAAHSPSAGGST